jgi:hypothetical protein
MAFIKRHKFRRTGKQKDREAVGREFAHAIDAAYSGLSRASYEKSLSILRRIEAEHVVRLPNLNHREFTLELRRRTSELMVEQALIHGCSLTECRKKLAIAEGLGWSLIDRKLHFHLLYARGMVARGHYRTATAISNRCIADVKQELQRIEQLPRRRGRKYFMEWLNHFSQVLDQVRESNSPEFSCRWNAGGRFIRNRT